MMKVQIIKLIEKVKKIKAMAFNKIRNKIIVWHIYNKIF